MTTAPTTAVAAMSDPASGADRITEHVTCLGCGCACDDIDVVVADDRIVEARRACPLGLAWFGDGRVPSRSRVDGADVSPDDALGAISRLLAGAARPLVYLAPDISCETQREATALADLLRASLDSVASATVLASVLAAQERGRAGATLGEIRNRADVIVFWGVDPALRYPRYMSRYAPGPAGVHVPDGRRSRMVIAVDIGDSRGPADADRRFTVAPDDEITLLTALRGIVAGPPAGGAAANPGGAPWDHARELAPVLLAARYAVVVHDGEPSSATRDAARGDALIALTQELNGPIRCALSTLRAGGNRSGAEAVSTSQTGFPLAVDFARGYPRYRPHDGTAAQRLARGEIDAVLVIGSAALVPDDVQAAMAAVPCAAIGPRASESRFAASGIVVDSAVAGIHEGGTALRMDDIPLPLRPSLSGLPNAVGLVGALVERIRRIAPRDRVASGPSDAGAPGASPPESEAEDPASSRHGSYGRVIPPGDLATSGEVVPSAASPAAPPSAPDAPAPNDQIE